MKDLETIYLAARELSVDRRAAFLEQACEGDAQKRARVEQMLGKAEAAQAFFDEPTEAGRGIPPARLGASAFTPVEESVGQTLGRYKLLEKVGEGGCGVVYVAEQTEPVRRRVALKVIKLGMDTKQVVARFEAERQALAMMDHPNIAKVLDAGTSEKGRPFFVMELVRGIKITDYCDQANLSTKQRLDLFIKVCQAVQHAHQKGIIHRDIKPSNILVTLHDGVPVPKVIDFGIAKATEGRLTDNTVYTQLHQFIGTPAYMSPEQAELSGLDIDTRADVYSLGVLLYELLTGVTPFDRETLAKAALDEIRRMIRETEPSKPSTRLQTLGDKLTEVAKHRSSEPAELSRLVRGDLDWIVMKCLEKDRTRRYETANGLATDLQRHLRNEAVTARPPSALYQFQTFARRNRATLAAASVIALSLIVGTVFSTVEALRANRNSHEAERQAKRAAKSAEEEAEQRKRAEDLAEQNRQHLYAARINLAQQIFEQGDVARVSALLDSLRPAAGQTDLRGFEWYHLWRLCHSETHHLVGHTAAIRSVAYSADGLLLATAGNEHDIRLWDAATGRERRGLAGHEGWVSSVAFAADGKLASGSADRTVRLWDAASGQTVFTFDGFTNEVTTVAFSARGDLLAAASGEMASGSGNPLTRYVVSGRGGEVRIWNPATRQLVCAFHAQWQGVMSLAFASEGETIATGSADRTVKVWDVKTGKERKTPVMGGPAFSLAYSPGGEMLAVASWLPYKRDAEIQLWNAKSWTMIGRISRIPAVTCIAFAPDGHTLASGGIDQAVRIWDTESGLERETFKGHTKGVWALAFAPDGRTLASGSWDRTVKLWDLNRSPQSAALGEACGYSVAFSPDGKLLACGGNDFVEIWDLKLEQRVQQLRLGQTVDDVLVAFSPDGRTLAAAGTDRMLSIFDTQSWQLRHAFRGHRDTIWNLAFSPDSRIIATGSSDSTIKLWDLVRGEERATLAGHQGTVRSLAFTPDGRTLITGGSRELKLWDVASAKLLESSEDISPLVTLSPDGKLLASTADSNAGVIRIRDFTSRRELARIEGHKDVIYHLAFSADGKTLATASWDGTAKLWRALGGELLMTIPSGLGVAWSAAFSRDGQAFAVGSGSRSTGGRVVVLRAATESQATAPEPRVAAVASPRTGRFPEPKASLDATIEPRSPQATPELIDLSAYYNGSLTRGWIPSSRYGSTVARNLGELPRGVQEFAGTRFDVRGLIQLAGLSLNRTLAASYPLEVKGIRVDQKCRRLQFLHGTGWRGGEGQTIGRYVIRYVGGAQQEVPIIYGGNVRDWWHDPESVATTPDAAVAWTGKNEAVRNARTVLQLYKFTWNNPQPDLTIESVDFVSLNTQSSPFLIALTVEP